MFALRLIVLGSLLIPLGGCSQLLDLTPDLDGGVEVPAPSLEVLTGEPITLLTDESAEIRVVYRDPEGEPIADADVSFRIDTVDSGLDATLGYLNVLTDESGVATTTIAAGSSSATFRIRVSAEGAAAVFIDVSISDSGFGDLEATVAYGGTRMPDALHVVAFGEMDCDEAFASIASPQRMQDVDAAGGMTTFVDLPADIDYAVGVYTTTSAGAVASWGCAEDVSVLAEQTASASATALDLPMGVTGVYAAEAEVVVAGAPAVVESATVAASAFVVDAAGGDVAYLLDPVRGALFAASDPCAVAFDSAFDATVVAVSVDFALLGLGPKPALASLAATISPNAERFDLSGGLTITGDDPSSASLQYELNGLALGPDDGSTPRAVDLDALGVEVTGTFDADFSVDGSTLTLNQLDVGVTTSQLLAALVALEMDAQMAASPAALIADDVGCAMLVTHPSVATLGCNQATMMSACDAAVDVLIPATVARVESVADAEHDELRISGSFPVVDDDDDLQADEMSGSLGGTWTSDISVSPLPVTGTFSALRVGAAPISP